MNSINYVAPSPLSLLSSRTMHSSHYLIRSFLCSLYYLCPIPALLQTPPLPFCHMYIYVNLAILVRVLLDSRSVHAQFIVLVISHERIIPVLYYLIEALPCSPFTSSLSLSLNLLFIKCFIVLYIDLNLFFSECTASSLSLVC